jgi:2-methylisocitrate lyase-like PEP mutase family enzyme
MRLKHRLEKKTILQVPGVYDTLGALIAEQVGFEACYVSGAGIAYSQLGRPDLGLVSAKELCDQVARIVDRVSIPVIVDGDTGFGGVLNVERLVRALDKMGAQAVQLEDQTFPKRCGHLTGKSLIPVEEMIAKIRAAVDSRIHDDFLIIARTDAIAVEGLECALERIVKYRDAGADVLFVEAPRSVEEMQKIISATRPVPAMANMVEGGKTPYLTSEELENIGFRVVIYPNALTRRIVYAVRELFSDLKTLGTTQPHMHQMVMFDEINKIMGIDRELYKQSVWVVK